MLLDRLKQYNVVLASNSPRRRELLADLGIEFAVRTLKGIDESFPPELPVLEIAEYISRKKAHAYQSEMNPGELIITADTVVILGDEVLGKPTDADDARRMLRELSGKTHKVVTGVTILTNDKISSFSAVTDVEFAQLSDDDINYYVDNYHPLDKAGAYGIQEWIGCMGVRHINGSFYNVMGLPLHRLYNELERLLKD
ncbi:MAG: septum formation protein Maf [Muribaculaceae bacterium]|nr:septum formation protein Maf [Muribaculaceae bacterium]MBR5119241.1 septum formation protein Maf [Muribaculaceae bacterium]